MQSCKKKSDDAQPCIAGTGGDVQVIVFAQHGAIHFQNHITRNDTAFVKFGITTSPGIQPSSYDTYFIGGGIEDHIHCTGLKCGDYYIFRTPVGARLCLVPFD